MSGVAANRCEGPTAAGSSVFATTHWSVVLAAGDSSRPGAQEALEQLCRSYWYPLYAYIRRRGYGPEDAQDLTQSFFAHLLGRNALQRVAKEKGKFRSFLLASFNYFLADERDRAQAQKRGGGCEVISLDAQEAEQRYRLELADERSPDKIFEHRWALTLLDQVLTRLRREFSDAGKSELFEQAQPFLVEGARTKTYAEAARQCGMSTEALKKAVVRMRRQYGWVFREEITRTVGSAAEVEEELRHLCAVLSS
jgi:RNA polymerase sigma-70 factor (ECF subfamily)